MREVLGEKGAEARSMVKRSQSSRNGRNSQSRRRSASARLSASALKRMRFGLAPSSPRRFFLSASYSW